MNFVLIIVEMIAFYCAKASKKNLEVNQKTGVANVS